jgi:uncharacterized protein (TIGR02594 family)
MNLSFGGRMIEYRVTAHSLNVREEPRLRSRIIGALYMDEIVQGISVSGDEYWYKIRTTTGLEGWSSHKFLVLYDGDIVDEEFSWMPVALQEIGIKEYVGAADNPRIVEYLSSTTLDSEERSNDETPWCSAFVNWCLVKAGYEGTDSAWAKSWLAWGKELDAPRRGCLTLFSRNEGGHVAFFVGESSSGIDVLGGTQSNAVKISSYPKSRLLGYRIPG